MKNVFTCAIAITVSLAFACDVDEESSWREGAGSGWTDEELELVDLDEPEASPGSELEPPVDSGASSDLAAPTPTAAGPNTGYEYWEFDEVKHGCGSCLHTVPEPDRSGKRIDYHKRWCVVSPTGSLSCGNWILTSSTCLDVCF